MSIYKLLGPPENLWVGRTTEINVYFLWLLLSFFFFGHILYIVYIIEQTNLKAKAFIEQVKCIFKLYRYNNIPIGIYEISIVLYGHCLSAYQKKLDL